MDLFPIGAFVRLRNRARGKYLHADEDAIHVSLRPLGAVPSLNAVWKVGHRPVEGGGNDVLLLLQGAAYGQYLAVAHEDEVTPSGVRAIQRDYNLPNLDPLFMWTPYRVEAGQNYVRLHDNDQRCLRANGRYRNWNNLVSVDVRNGDETTMMQWRVEAIPSTPEPLPLPPPPQPPIRVRRGLFRRRMHQHPGRRIWHFRLDDDGNPVSDDWPSLVSHDNSLANLRAQVARLEHDENITLGVRAGYNARVIPLVTNLPNNADPMQIIVYTTGSPGMPKALIYIEEKMEMRRNDGQAYQEWLELSDPSSESDDENGDPTYHPNEGNEDGEGSNGAGYGGSSGGSDDDNSSGDDDDNDDDSSDDDDGDDGSDDNDSSDEDEEDSDYVPDLQDDEDDDEEYMALVATQPPLPEGVFTAHGVTYVNYLHALPELDPRVHILGFGPLLSLARRIQLWRRGDRRGFDFEPTEMLRWVWRIELLLDGRNPGNPGEAPNEPPVPNPGDYEAEGWTTDEEVMGNVD